MPTSPDHFPTFGEISAIVPSGRLPYVVASTCLQMSVRNWQNQFSRPRISLEQRELALGLSAIRQAATNNTLEPPLTPQLADMVDRASTALLENHFWTHEHRKTVRHLLNAIVDHGNHTSFDTVAHTSHHTSTHPREFGLMAPDRRAR